MTLAGQNFGPDLLLRGLSKSFGPTAVLEELDLAIPGGRFTVLLGGSGCGKTTCLRLIAGLEQPSAGAILIGDRDVTALPPAARGVAMVFQSYALFPHLSVAENILFGLKARRVGRAEREARLRRAAELLGIAHLLARKPGQISGGQQQRVALGRAIVAETPVCLMDEPLSNLDAQLRAEMRREIVALQRRLGLTMIYVTHDQTEAMSMADQVVVLRAGRLEQAAPPAEVYERPATAFVAGFIGTPPMNLLSLTPHRGGLAVAGTDAVLPVRAENRALIAGLRPESLSLSAHAAASGALPLLVEHAEYLGADTVLTGRIGAAGPVLQARLPGRSVVAPGASVRLFYDPRALHLFDAQTGARIAAAPSMIEPQPEQEAVT
ncbi:MAG TPA: ABC transporter ATP-binding protein [Acetobacteraceae bacterium]|nr:ABC transporter ATP-binding protein [Acetobacteraceae bacterium]